MFKYPLTASTLQVKPKWQYILGIKLLKVNYVFMFSCKFDQIHQGKFNVIASNTFRCTEKSLAPSSNLPIFINLQTDFFAVASEKLLY